MKGGVEVLATNPWLGDLLSIAFALAIVGLADVAYRLVENPGRQLGERLLRRRAPVS